MSKLKYKLISQAEQAKRFHVYTVSKGGVHIAVIQTMQLERGSRVRIDIIYNDGRIDQLSGMDDSFPFSSTVDNYVFNNEVMLFKSGTYVMRGNGDIPIIEAHEKQYYVTGFNRLKLFNYEITKVL